MARSGEQARQRLMDAAESLFAAKGLASVTLSEINKLADQRNRSAVQYHFGDRHGLLRCIADRHAPTIEARQWVRLVELRRAGVVDPVRVYAEVMLRPLLEYARHGPSARAWVTIASDIAADPSVDNQLLTSHMPAVLVEVGRDASDHLRGTMPENLAAHRLRTLTAASLRTLADRVRHESACRLPADALGMAEFGEDLIATLAAGLSAPAPAMPLQTSTVATASSAGQRPGDDGLAERPSNTSSAGSPR